MPYGDMWGKVEDYGASIYGAQLHDNINPSIIIVFRP
jgi:hypothetical protein